MEINVTTYSDFKSLPLSKKLFVIFVIPLIVLLVLAGVVFVLGLVIGFVAIVIPIILIVIFTAISLTILGAAAGFIFHYFRTITRR